MSIPFPWYGMEIFLSFFLSVSFFLSFLSFILFFFFKCKGLFCCDKHMLTPSNYYCFLMCQNNAWVHFSWEKKERKKETNRKTSSFNDRKKLRNPNQSRIIILLNLRVRWTSEYNAASHSLAVHNCQVGERVHLLEPLDFQRFLILPLVGLPDYIRWAMQQTWKS